MSRKEWAFGNSGEICAYCHRLLTEICGCGGNDLKFKALIKNYADAMVQVKKLEAIVKATTSLAYESDELGIQGINFCLVCNTEWGCGHDEGCVVGQAQSLIPDLEKAREKAK